MSSLNEHRFIKETAAAISIILLIIWIKFREPWLVYCALVLLLFMHFFPKGLTPLAFILRRLFSVVNYLVIKLLFGSLYFFLLVPVGLIRRLMGKDRLLLKEWKKGSKTLFVCRDHEFTGADLENPF